MKIIVTKRSCDYHACIEHFPTRWGCGKTMVEAVGDLVTSHPECFDIQIVTPPVDKPKAVERDLSWPM